ncbi:MAG: ABC transporter permease subunit [Treponema sp.]|jgi:NitT/TauT family transport system permease protein|nr:ABC transporter permease subunit [Treponema sp.]
MSNSSKILQKRWLDDPRVTEDTRYWKPKSEVWARLSVASFVLAFMVSLFVPNAESVKPIPYQTVLALIIVILVALYIFGLHSLESRKQFYHKAQFIFAGGVTLTLWDLLTSKTGALPIPYFPSMADIFFVMFDDRKLLLRSTLYSMRLFFTGLVTGTIAGLGTGVLIGWLRQWDYWLAPIIRVTGIIPAVAWLPVAFLILPTSFATGVFLIFISSWFPVSSMMAGGIIGTPKSFYEVGRTLGASKKFLLWKIAIPNALPSMFTGIMTATAFSFTTLIVSEMVGAKAGLGFYINWAKGWGAYSKVYAALIIIAVEFSLILAGLGSIKNYALRWQKGLLK